jgi:hypothetical protein
VHLQLLGLGPNAPGVAGLNRVKLLSECMHIGMIFLLLLLLGLLFFFVLIVIVISC